jgi:hypothetical protein
MTCEFHRLVTIGYTRPQAKAKSSARAWTETLSSSQIADPTSIALKGSTDWRLGDYTIAQSGDECHIGSWVFLHQSTVHYSGISELKLMYSI